MSLTPLTSNGLVSIQSTAYGAQSLLEPIRDGQNEPLNDIWQSNALNVLQVDTNVQYVNSKARYATSTGDDLDSAFEIFGVRRVQAQPSGAVVSVALLSPSGQDVYIQIGSTFQTSSGLQFFVIADNTKSAYSGLGYLIPANTTSAISISVQCVTPGAIGNVQANTITSYISGLGSAAPGSLTVTNPTAASGGSEKEDDPTYINRFQLEIQSGRWGTNLAILVAIASAYTGLTFQLYEAKNPDGSDHSGFFTIFVNVLGATTSTPQPIIDAVKLQVALVKACGINYTVVSPTLQVVPAAASFVIDANYVTSDVLSAASAAYANYVNSIGLNVNGSATLLSYAKVSAVLVTVPGVINVLSFTLNSGTADITAAVGHQFVAGATTFTAA